MSIFLGKNKYWQKVVRQVKLISENNLFFSVTEDWQDVVSLIPFPLEKNATLESEFVKFVSYDLNSKKINKVKIIDYRNVKAV